MNPRNTLILMDSRQERMEGRYAGKGYRQLLIDNYIAVFRIDEATKTVKWRVFCVTLKTDSSARSVIKTKNLHLLYTINV